MLTPQSHEFAALGVTDNSGTFSLQTFVPGDGAVPGTFEVLISRIHVEELPGGAVKETNLLPTRYRIPSKSGLFAEVTQEGPNLLRFELVK